MKSPRYLSALGTILLACLSVAAQAAQINYQFTWQVTGMTASAENVFTDITQVGIGDTFSGVFAYNDAQVAPAFNGLGNPVTVQFNDFLLSSSYEIFMYDGFNIQASSGIPFSYPRSPFQGFFSLWVHLVDSTGQTSFASLPASLTLSDFDIRTIDISVLGGPTYPNSVFTLSGEVISLSRVPLPHTLLLFGSGLAGLAGVMRRRRPT